MMNFLIGHTNKYIPNTHKVLYHHIEDNILTTISTELYSNYPSYHYISLWSIHNDKVIPLSTLSNIPSISDITPTPELLSFISNTINLNDYIISIPPFQIYIETLLSSIHLSFQLIPSSSYLKYKLIN